MLFALKYKKDKTPGNVVFVEAGNYLFPILMWPEESRIIVLCIT